MYERASAKINLYLRVVGRRPDGYHLLDSLAVFPPVGDRLRAEPADGLSLAIEGPFARCLADAPDNLVLRAARALAAEAGIVPRARLVLEKCLPVAAGIGGGSADAAATLRLLTRFWDLPVDNDAFGRIAATLGADVPVCLWGKPARMRGIGERLDPAPLLPPFGIALVNPGFPLATSAVFSARSGGWSEEARLPASWGSAQEMAADLAALGNDLESAAIRLCPAIAEVLCVLRSRPGCLLAGMSGSGATCFGIFAGQDEAPCVAANGTWWCWPH